MASHSVGSVSVWSWSEIFKQKKPCSVSCAAGRFAIHSVDELDLLFFKEVPPVRADGLVGDEGVDLVEVEGVDEGGAAELCVVGEQDDALGARGHADFDCAFGVIRLHDAALAVEALAADEGEVDVVALECRERDVADERA